MRNTRSEREAHSSGDFNLCNSTLQGRLFSTVARMEHMDPHEGLNGLSYISRQAPKGQN
jgi:hypothetical protein